MKISIITDILTTWFQASKKCWKNKTSRNNRKINITYIKIVLILTNKLYIYIKCMWLFFINKSFLLISFYKFFNNIYFTHFILLLKNPHSIIIHSSTTTLPAGTDITLSKMLHLCDPICRQRVLTVSYVGILDHLILVILEKAKESHYATTLIWDLLIMYKIFLIKKIY